MKVFQRVVSSGLVCALVLGGLNSVLAQTRQRTRSGSSHEVRRVSMVIGGSVRIGGDVSVGQIEDVVINDRGCIDYVVVVYHDKYVPIPWTATTVDFSKRIVTVDITEERFAEVPTFTRDEFSMLSKNDFTQKVHSAFGAKGERKPRKSGGKAESPQREPKVTKSEPKAEPPKAAVPETPKVGSPPEPPKAAVPEKPKVGSPEKPKGESNDKPKGESQEKPKVELKDKPKK